MSVILQEQQDRRCLLAGATGQHCALRQVQQLLSWALLAEGEVEVCSTLSWDTLPEWQQQGRRLLQKEQMEAWGHLRNRHSGHSLTTGCSWQPCRRPHESRLPGIGSVTVLLHSSCSCEVSLPVLVVATPIMQHTLSHVC